MRRVYELRVERVKEYINEFIKTTGKGPTYRQIQKGTDIPSLKTVKTIIARLREEGEINIDEDSPWNSIGVPANLKIGGTVKSSILGECKCGEPFFGEENIIETVPLPVSIFGDQDHFLMYASGRSMILRGIYPGDLMAILPDRVPNVGDVVIAEIAEEGITAKVYMQDTNGVPYLQPASDDMDTDGNPIFKDIHPKGDWKVLGVVDKVIHTPKKI